MKIKKSKVDLKSHYYIGEAYSYDLKRTDEFYIEDGHIACFGTTGCGKTTAMLRFIEEDIKNGKSVFYIDPKGEISVVNKIYEKAIENNRSKELMLLNPMWENLSAKMNPLRIGGKYGKPEEITNRVLSAIPKTYGDASFFRDLGYELLTIIINGLMIEKRYIDQESNNGVIEINYKDIYGRLSQNGLRTIKARIKNFISEAELDSLLKWISADPEWFGKVTANIATTVAQMSIGMLGKVLGGVKHYQKDIIGQLYNGDKIIAGAWFPSLKISESTSIACKAIFAALQGYISECQLQRKKAALRIYVDEAKETFYPSVCNIFTQARSADVYIRFFAQSYEGIESVIGESETSEIMQNVKTIILMKSGNYDTPNRIMRLLPPVVKQIPGQEFSGFIRTMGTESTQIEINDVLRLKVGEYFALYQGGLYKGRIPNIKESKINISEDKSTDEEGKHNIPFKSIAFRNWLDDKEYNREHKEIEEQKHKLISLMDDSIKIMQKHLGEYQESFMFSAGKINDMPEHLAINTEQYIRLFKHNQIKFNVEIAEDKIIKELTSAYLQSAGLIYSGDGLKINKNKEITAEWIYKDLDKKYIKVWVIKTDGECKEIENKGYSIRLLKRSETMKDKCCVNTTPEQR